MHSASGKQTGEYCKGKAREQRIHQHLRTRTQHAVSLCQLSAGVSKLCLEKPTAEAEVTALLQHQLHTCNLTTSLWS